MSKDFVPNPAVSTTMAIKREAPADSSPLLGPKSLSSHQKFMDQLMSPRMDMEWKEVGLRCPQNPIMPTRPNGLVKAKLILTSFPVIPIPPKSFFY